MSPFIPQACSVRSRVVSRDLLVFSWDQSGSVNMSRTVPMSVPMDFWNSTISSLVTSTSPYMWLWKVPESVMMTPGKSRSSCRPFSWASSLSLGVLRMMYEFVMRARNPNLS